ncbi:ParA family protein [Micromonospora sp. ALFpr18c]|uniref:ParA family protein n=1 Tax=Micromonospora sp. ALFpr18c TaxID=1458665 RepID=UPI00124B9253|nr:ParA family protein [Micromonospora sp. ALFpr18c]KAB1943175.1 ParA family protein [Micromonospora sp. ALFpr18c]
MTSTAVVNQKGGVGKTELTTNIGGALAELGRRVLLVDLDPSGYLTDGLKVTPSDGFSLAEALTSSRRARVEPVRHSTTEQGGVLDVLPNTAAMLTVARELDKLRGREQRLTRVLAPLAGDYDDVLIDCPPTLDVVTDNALAWAERVLIPVQAEDTTLKALQLLLAQIAAVDEFLRDERLVLHGMVVSMLRRPASVYARSVLDDLAKLAAQADLPILGTVPLSVVVSEARRHGRTVVDYAPNSHHATVYRALAKTFPEIR